MILSGCGWFLAVANDSERPRMILDAPRMILSRRGWFLAVADDSRPTADGF